MYNRTPAAQRPGNCHVERCWVGFPALTCSPRRQQHVQRQIMAQAVRVSSAVPWLCLEVARATWDRLCNSSSRGILTAWDRAVCALCSFPPVEVQLLQPLQLLQLLQPLHPFHTWRLDKMSCHAPTRCRQGIVVTLHPRCFTVQARGGKNAYMRFMRARAMRRQT